MYSYHNSGFPYSDELYHYGILGMKWGVRRYQNSDGTLTPLGKVHYSALKAASAVGKSAKNAGKAIGKAVKTAGKTTGRAAKKVAVHQVDKFKMKHKWVMSDAELQEKIKRLDMEKRYQDLLKGSRPQVGRGRKAIGEMLEEGGKTISRAAFNKLADKMFNKPDTDSPAYQFAEAFKDQWENSQSRPSQADLDEAVKYVNALRMINGDYLKKKG